MDFDDVKLQQQDTALTVRNVAARAAAAQQRQQHPSMHVVQA
jgi:hypothetical protein